ncbi:hypothetical protein E24_00129 [Faustovirus]|nr:hypothetical protein PRJ_Fausto_00117 [Faustovirus]AMN83061.1 hypothetical protein E24_00129 [Faustovirus]AMN84045.1 hypothetical protein D5a_00129 [Faustovirus]AMN85031.1 hypothetical protein E23_00129 [Faustovirus]QBR99031.1 hypothetical protein [Faustovirus mariensis]
MSKQTKPKAVAPKQAVVKPKRGKKEPVATSEEVTPVPEPSQQPQPTTSTDAKETNELATAPATTKLSLRDLTVQRYQSKGWQIMNTPRGGINDLVAGKSVSGKYRYHFVQFVESEDDIDNAMRYKGEAKGAFIQNAYSNQATPVYVISRKQGANRKVVLENADTTQKIIP